MKRLVFLAILGCCSGASKKLDTWSVAENSHFKIYSQTSDDTAKNALCWFEELQTFFEQTGVAGSEISQKRTALRVVGFASEKEYKEYRPQTIADAAYISDEGGDFIIMASLHPSAFGIAAHEYAHYVLHNNGLKLPRWLNEGLAEFFSTLKFKGAHYELGGDLLARTQILKQRKWLPLPALFQPKDELHIANTREDAEIFYAESWALVDMLMTSQRYSVKFHQLLSELDAGSKMAEVVEKLYAESIDDLTRDLENWVGHTRPIKGTLILPHQPVQVHYSELSVRQASALLAQLLLDCGRLELAQARYQQLSRGEPKNPDVSAALGAIALRLGKRDEALRQWRQALTNGVRNAQLCYRYALLVEEAGGDPHAEKAALARSVALSPNFDDARYKLALLESQAGEYQLAIEQLQAMRVPEPPRRFAYWIAMASNLTEVDARAEAERAAGEALKAAKDETQRQQAIEMAYVAKTDLTVQFATDTNGHSQVITTRVPHGTKDWNPFIEPSDNIQSTKGAITEVLCDSGKLTGFLLRTPIGSLTVDIPDPMHVLIRNGPNELFCGPTQEKEVAAEYAIKSSFGVTRNVLRGMTFQQ